MRAGVRARMDGWRRAAGLVLRSPRSTFVLSAFGLSMWSDSPEVHESGVTEANSRLHVVMRLDKFLRGETGLHIRVRRGGLEDRGERCDGPRYTLAFEAWRDGPERFVRPESWTDGALSDLEGDESMLPLFNVVCRIGPLGQVDVWFRIDHVGADGVPVQEMLSRLETQWGFAESVVFPTSAEFAACHVLRRQEGVCEVQTFIDFKPLLEWRKCQNQRLTDPMTLSAAMLWRLGSHPAFESLQLGTTVEVEAVGGLGRGVGVVVVRPADYMGRADGLSEYVRVFNRTVSLTKARSTAACHTLDAAARLPPGLARDLLRHSLERDPRAFGSMALTMLKDARVFGAPIAEFGHADGFIAVGSVALPARDGTRVGCVTVKGPEARIASYPELIREAVEAPSRL